MKRMSLENTRWIDCTLFNGEPIVLLRLQYLFDSVDVFYICEARYTYQGKRKETLYIDAHKDWFEPYLSKIKFHVYEDEFVKLWDYERDHRNSPAELILKNEAQPYVVSCSDVDEIPDLSKLPEKHIMFLVCQKYDGKINIMQDMYYYNFNWRMKGGYWAPSFFINSVCLANHREFAKFRSFNYAEMKGIFKCGWHFSYFQTVPEIIRKLESFSHAEFNFDQYKKEEYILDCITNGKDILLRDFEFTKEDLSVFPPEFLEFGRKWLPAFTG